MGHQLAGGNSSWCSELESQTTQTWDTSLRVAAAAGAPELEVWTTHV